MNGLCGDILDQNYGKANFHVSKTSLVMSNHLFFELKNLFITRIYTIYTIDSLYTAYVVFIKQLCQNFLYT